MRKFNVFDYVNSRWQEANGQKARSKSVISDMILRPVSVMLDGVMANISDSMYVNNLDNSSGFSTEEADIAGSKFFKKRARGEVSVGVARIFFDDRPSFSITTETTFTTNESLVFVPAKNENYNPMSYSTNRDLAYKANYYIDVVLHSSVEGSEYNIKSGSITSANIGVKFAFVTNIEPFRNGYSSESTDSYFNRIKMSSNDGSIQNARGIQSIIPDLFPAVKSISVSSSFDEFIERDNISVGGDKNSVSYSGKIPGDIVSVRSIAYFDSYPTFAISPVSYRYGPYSIYTDHDKPKSISPLNLSSKDPYYHGVTTREFDLEMYSGIYHDNKSRSTPIETGYLFISSKDKFTRSGFHNSPSSYISSDDSIVTSDGGAIFNSVSKNPSVAMENIGRKTGFKANCRIKFTGEHFSKPDMIGHHAAIGFAGRSSNAIGNIDGLSGYGVGVYIRSRYTNSTTPNAVMYLYDSESYEIDEFFMPTRGDISIPNALQTIDISIKPGVNYELEITVGDKKTNSYSDDSTRSVSMTVLINEISNSVDSLSVKMIISEKNCSILSQKLFSSSNTYGTYLKVMSSCDLDTADKRSIEFSGIRVFDLTIQKAYAIFAIDSKDLGYFSKISIQATASGIIDGKDSRGFSVLLWDISNSVIPSDDEGISGEWISFASEADGKVEIDIVDIKKYSMNKTYDNYIYIMVISDGTSGVMYYGDKGSEQMSTIDISHIGVSGEGAGMRPVYSSANVYVDTISNSRKVISKSVTVKAYGSRLDISSANGSEPILQIISVTKDGNQLSSGDYTVVKTGEVRSSREKCFIEISNSYGVDESDYIVEYEPFLFVKEIQDLFSNSVDKGVSGDVLVIHKEMVNVSIGINYFGSIPSNNVDQLIKHFFDTMVSTQFTVTGLISYLIESGVKSIFSYSVTVDGETGESGLYSIPETKSFFIETLSSVKIEG